MEDFEKFLRGITIEEIWNDHGGNVKVYQRFNIKATLSEFGFMWIQAHQRKKKKAIVPFKLYQTIEKEQSLLN